MDGQVALLLHMPSGCLWKRLAIDSVDLVKNSCGRTASSSPAKAQEEDQGWGGRSSLHFLGWRFHLFALVMRKKETWQMVRVGPPKSTCSLLTRSQQHSWVYDDSDLTGNARNVWPGGIGLVRVPGYSRMYVFNLFSVAQQNEWRGRHTDTLWGTAAALAGMARPSLLISQPSHFKDVFTSLVKSLIGSWTKPLRGNFLQRPFLLSILALSL